MKQYEILKEENIHKKYQDTLGNIWTVKVVGENLGLYKFGYDKKDIVECFKLSEINNIEFEEILDGKVNIGDKYFFINHKLEIKESFFDNDKIDYERINLLNFYPYTSENKKEILKKVELIRDRKLLHIEIMKFAKENNEKEINWTNKNQIKYNLRIDYHNSEIYIASTYAYRDLNQIYFNNEYIAEKALDKFKDKIIKLYIHNEIN